MMNWNTPPVKKPMWERRDLDYFAEKFTMFLPQTGQEGCSAEEKVDEWLACGSEENYKKLVSDN